MVNPNQVNTEKWDANSVVLIQSKWAKIHRNMVLKRSRFHNLVTDKNAKILDVGCGSGPFLVYFASQGFNNLYGIEPDAALIKNIPAGLPAQVKACRAEKMEFNDAAFDVAFVYGVLHHLKGDAAYQAAMDEIYRVLKPGGLLFIMEPGRYRLFRCVEVAAGLLGVFSRTFKSFAEVLVEEKPDLHYFLQNHGKIRQYAGRNFKTLVDRYFIYTWIFTVQKTGPTPVTPTRK